MPTKTRSTGGDRIAIDTARAGTSSLVGNRIPAAELASAALARCLRISRSLQGPFLRRDEEHRILQENLEAVSAGGVRIVCLTGEPGAGKTTLLEHFIAGIEKAPGQLVTFSACSQRLAGAEAFLPLLDSLDGLTRAGENAAITRLLKLTAPTWYVQIAPLWSTVDPGFASVLERARAASPERVKRELSSFVAHVTAVLPLVIAIDDLHWADASTVEVLAYLLSRPELKRVLLVCAYRQTEMSLSAHPFVSRSSRIGQTPTARRGSTAAAQSRGDGGLSGSGVPGQPVPEGACRRSSRLEATAIPCSSVRSLAT